ncbi:sigma-70 family RNA polymerase sigma factor [Aliikangiella coralliicola]|uniref:Sigma-70 family RNA polymerase sigma factor n=1 Tax=Aliikangiella coralliicola TaxID=2592383 RepID=A0A545UCW5_9GAMM|nr:sigma-70 family RNA polymerase sigma factor [Aliikangiella coralliicola]TQV87307.1 sigma-70 family RNA polymerase sigma factor [Aliikangiella coralliicola]
MISKEDEKPIVYKLLNKETEGLSLLYDLYASRLLRVAIKILQDKADAEDLLHDVFLEAWHKVHLYDCERGSLYSWLSIMTKSRAIDRLRALRAIKWRSSCSDHTIELEAGENHQRLLDYRSVERAVAKLTDTQKLVLDLGYRKGLTYQEIAEQCDIPIGTVKSRLFSAVNKLRQLLVKPAEVKL